MGIMAFSFVPGLLLVACSLVAAQEENLALGKPTLQSSWYKWGWSQKAVDGRTGGNFASRTCSQTDVGDVAPWWAVDLQAEYDVTSVVIWNRVDCCSERLEGITVVVSNVEFSSDINYEDIASFSFCAIVAEDPGREVTLACQERTRGRYVYLYQQLEVAPISLCEVEIYGAAAPLNLALGQPTMQSSLHETARGVSERAVDGGYDGVYSNLTCTHTANEPAPWWSVDLGAEYDVTAVVVYNREDCCGHRLNGLSVKVSDVPFSSDIDYADIDSFSLCATLTERAQRENSLVCEKGTTGRYVYLYRPTGVSAALTLCEVEIYGTML